MRKGVCHMDVYLNGGLGKLYLFVKLFILLSSAKQGYPASSKYTGLPQNPAHFSRLLCTKSIKAM